MPLKSFPEGIYCLFALRPLTQPDPLASERDDDDGDGRHSEDRQPY